MKYLLFSIFAISFVHSFAQCPEEYIEFNNQAEVDAFAQQWPNCTFFDNTIIINSTSEENPILNLTGLSNLEGLTSLRVLGLGEMDDYAQFTGLENITSLGNLVIRGQWNQSVFIESLAPLNQISGAIDSLSLEFVHLAEEIPDFNFITNLNRFRILYSDGIVQTPLFESLSQLGGYEVIGSLQSESSLTSVYIPNEIEELDANAYMVIKDFPSVEEIIGGGNLESCGSIHIKNLPGLNSVEPFTNLVSCGDLYLESCREDLFTAFQYLEDAQQVGIRINVPEPDESCISPIETLDLRIGENSDEFVCTSFVLLADSIEELNVLTSLTETEYLYLNVGSCAELTGFENLNKLTRTPESLILYSTNLVHLPNFENLTEIRGALKIFPHHTLSMLENLEGLESLEFLEELEIKGHNDSGDPFPNLSSLNGLESVDTLNFLTLKDLSSLSDISALNGVSTSKEIRLRDLPSLAAFDFDNLSSLSLLLLYNLGIDTSPSLPSMFQTEYMFFHENSNLSLIDFQNSINLDGGVLRLVDNQNLSFCGNMEAVCQLIETAGSVILEGNDIGCNTESEILEACALSTESQETNNFKLYPNPSNGKVRLEWVGSNHVSSIEIMDLTGRRVNFVETEPGHLYHELDFQDYPSGVYLITSAGTSGKSTVRFVKQ